MTTPTNEYKAWLAGFFDGEGCITLYANPGTEWKVPRVCIAQKDRIDLLSEIQTIYGGGVHPHKGSRMFRWFSSSRTEIQHFLTDVLPYLRVKRQKAELAIAICNLMGPGRSQQDQLTRLLLTEKFDAEVAAGKGN